MRSGTAIPKSAPCDNMRGVLLALLATGLYALAAAMAKVTALDYHVLQILFFRQVVVFLASLPSIALSPPSCLRTQYPGRHAIRLMGAFLALSAGIWAVALLPLTTAITLGFVQVFFVTLIAARFLGEPTGLARILAIAWGFAGVIVIMRPGFDGLRDLNALVPIAGAFGAALAATSVRSLAQTESTATLLIYQSVFVGLLASIPLIWLWKTPDLYGLLCLLATAVFATIGQWIGIEALRHGEASVVGSIQYVQLVYAALLGYLLFEEIPDAATLIGAAMIIVAASSILHHERKRKDKGA